MWWANSRNYILKQGEVVMFEKLFKKNKKSEEININENDRILFQEEAIARLSKIQSDISKEKHEAENIVREAKNKN